MGKKRTKSGDASTADPTRVLAERIARDLFTGGSGRHARRLVMEFPGDEKLLGPGWAEYAVIDRIEDMLRATTRPRPEDE